MAGGVIPPPLTAGMPGSLQPKPEDLNHPCQEQLPELKYCINDNPSWRKSLYPLLPFLSDALVVLKSYITCPKTSYVSKVTNLCVSTK